MYAPPTMSNILYVQHVFLTILPPVLHQHPPFCYVDPLPLTHLSIIIYLDISLAYIGMNVCGNIFFSRHVTSQWTLIDGV